RKRWWHRIQYVNSRWDKFGRLDRLKYDIIILDIERAHHSPEAILKIKQNPLIPAKFRELSNQEFINEYKLAMARLYYEPLKLLKDSLPLNLKVSSYGETPVRRNWWGINKFSWESWRKDIDHIDYLVLDENESVESDFYVNHSFIS